MQKNYSCYRLRCYSLGLIGNNKTLTNKQKVRQSFKHKQFRYHELAMHDDNVKLRQLDRINDEFEKEKT